MRRRRGFGGGRRARGAASEIGQVGRVVRGVSLKRGCLMLGSEPVDQELRASGLQRGDFLGQRVGGVSINQVRRDLRVKGTGARGTFLGGAIGACPPGARGRGFRGYPAVLARLAEAFLSEAAVVAVGRSGS